MLGIVVILMLVVVLIWACYLHHERAGRVDDETTMVSITAVEKFSRVLA